MGALLRLLVVCCCVACLRSFCHGIYGTVCFRPLVDLVVVIDIVKVLLGGGGGVPCGPQVLFQLAPQGRQARPLQRSGETRADDACGISTVALRSRKWRQT